MAILDLKNGNIVMAIVEAIVQGYREDLILDELAQAIERKEIDQASFDSAVEALKLFGSRLMSSLNIISDAMTQFEFHEPQNTILKSKPMTLAQQVMHDLDGFQNAVKEHGAEQGQEMPEEDNSNWLEMPVQ